MCSSRHDHVTVDSVVVARARACVCVCVKFRFSLFCQYKQVSAATDRPMRRATLRPVLYTNADAYVIIVDKLVTRP